MLLHVVNGVNYHNIPSLTPGDEIGGLESLESSKKKQKTFLNTLPL